VIFQITTNATGLKVNNNNNNNKKLYYQITYSFSFAVSRMFFLQRLDFDLSAVQSVSVMLI